ncbi:ABC transporter permease subunit [uncultured Roseobacter sp.]|uniref:amino acid ABC transporter permease n=1 Tax=uncultured Roseobacter sp. TaxID=114847 RepID=UPI00262CF037|nr:ABC transporter permease subunit [uncultured Roseobacter sp.]
MRKQIVSTSLIWQIAFFCAVVYGAAVAVQNVEANLARAGIAVSFSFMNSQAGFDISESLIEVSSSSSYARVFMAGVLNTLMLSAVCIAGATLIGVVMGVLRASTHALGTRVAHLYIELMRNLPKLLILLALFLAVINALPPVRQSWSVLDTIYVSNRAIYFPTLDASSGTRLLLVLGPLWLVGVLIGRRLAKRWQDRTGKVIPVVWPMSLAVLLILVGTAAFGLVRFPISHPELRGFDFQEGGRLSIQFVVLAAALSIYHGGQVAELVRGAIEAVPSGQSEAAKASGLNFVQRMRLVVLPQAVRVIVPPMGNQYLNITKNTSIGLAVGYSDLVSVMTTSINQTFRPIELMSLSMCIYLSICLTVSLLVNLYNRHIALKGR